LGTLLKVDGEDVGGDALGADDGDDTVDGYDGDDGERGQGPCVMDGDRDDTTDGDDVVRASGNTLRSCAIGVDAEGGAREMKC
jgi:hypothetical protein